MSRARGSEPEGAPVALSADELRACGAQEDETYQTAVYAQADPDYSVLTLVPGEGDLAGMKVGVVPVAAGSDDTDIVALPASAMAARRRAGKAVPHRFITSKADITSEARSEHAVDQAQDAGEDGVVPAVEVCLVRAPSSYWVARTYSPLDPGAAVDRPFLEQNGLPALPLASVLLSHLEQLGFATGEEGDAPPAAEGESSRLSSRVANLEGSLTRIESLLQAGGGRGTPAVPLLPVATPGEVHSRQAPERGDYRGEAPKRGDDRGEARGQGAPGLTRMVPGLDEDIVTAARARGIPEEALRHLGELFSKRPARLPERPGSRPLPKDGDLDESEEEGEEDTGERDGQSSSSIEKLVTSMAKVVKKLAADKPSSSSQNPIEKALEGLGAGDRGDKGEGWSVRKGTAVRRELRKALYESPEHFSNVVAKGILAAFDKRPVPGTSVEADARAYLEFRSHVQEWKTTINWMWMLGGIHSALTRGAAPEALARTSLALAAGEQYAIDGNWDIAWELTFEDLPPYPSFRTHTAPDPSQLPHTRLADPRWMDLAYLRLKDLDDVTERKARLTRARRGGPPPQLQADPKKKGKKGGGGKPLATGGDQQGA